jgi:multidrug resistance efflux pump
MELVAFLSSLIPLILIITVVKSVGSSLFGNKDGKESKFQAFMKEINQERDRLRNEPIKKEVSRTSQNTANLEKQRNNSYKSANNAPYRREALAERNRVQAVSQDEAVTRSNSNKQVAQSKKQMSKKRKQTSRQKELLKGIVYKEILDKPRALRPFR